MFSITLPSTAVGAQKQIAVQGVNTAGIVLYTVPTGRKFIGSFAPQTLAASYILINGTSICVNMTLTSGGFTSAVPVTLIAGTVVTSQSTAYACGLFGVESDA